MPGWHHAIGYLLSDLKKAQTLSRLKAAFQVRDFDVKLHVVSVELVVVVRQQVVSLQPEVLHDRVELVDKALHPFQLRKALAVGETHNGNVTNHRIVQVTRFGHGQGK